MVSSNPTIKLLRIVGSPFLPMMEPPGNSKEAMELYPYALKKRIGLPYLEALNRHGELGELKSEYHKLQTRYSETLITMAKLSKLLNPTGIEYTVFKTIRPFPDTLSDIDVLFLGTDEEYRKAADLLLKNGYKNIVEAPQQISMYDLRGGLNHLYKYKEGKAYHKVGGIYYIDLYKEAAVSHFVYLDKKKLAKHVTKVKLPDGEVINSLLPKAELLTLITHSVITEQIYTLGDYYAALHFLTEMDKEEIDSFINMVKENHVTLATKAFIAITAALHQMAHGTVPEKLDRISTELGTEASEAAKLTQNMFQTPHKYSLSTVAKALLEKMKEGKSRKSLTIQLLHMLNPRLLKFVVKELIIRRQRETSRVEDNL